MIKVSIIIPVYNGANYLREAIDSALAQTYQNLEIIVINDGSNDNGATEAIARAYTDKIRYFYKPNGGVASALNMAILHMTGEYFSWLSHDDLYVNNKIALQIQSLSNFHTDKVVLYSDYSIFTTDQDKDILCQMRGVLPEHFRYWITVENSLHGCTLLIPKTAFLECGFFDENLRTTQDYDLWFRIAKRYQFIHCPISLVKSRSHSEQGTMTMGDIVLKEGNMLLSNFVRDLSVSEIQQAADSSAGLGYAKIASSMWYRGFFPAGSLAAGLSIKHCFNISRNEFFLAQSIIMKGFLLYYVVKPMRKIFFPSSRLAFKNFLKPIIALLKPKTYPTTPE